MLQFIGHKLRKQQTKLNVNDLLKWISSSHLSPYIKRGLLKLLSSVPHQVLRCLIYCTIYFEHSVMNNMTRICCRHGCAFWKVLPAFATRVLSHAYVTIVLYCQQKWQLKLLWIVLTSVGFGLIGSSWRIDNSQPELHSFTGTSWSAAADSAAIWRMQCCRIEA